MKIFQVDSFTTKPFSGNPAGVCILPGPVSEQWMQNVAAGMNVAETAFLHREKDVFALRWFTPTVEVDLCGHATLASAHILYERGIVGVSEPIVFMTRSGRLTARKNGGVIEMDFPAEEENAVAPPAILADALHSIPLYVGRNRMDYIAEIATEEELRNLKPDIGKLMMLDGRGVIVTCRAAAAEYDFMARFFAPNAGISEDPVTGSAFCCLGPYWMKKLGKNGFHAYQCSRRGGEVDVRVDGGRVIIAGQAVTVLEAEISPPA